MGPELDDKEKVGADPGERAAQRASIDMARRRREMRSGPHPTPSQSAPQPLDQPAPAKGLLTRRRKLIAGLLGGGGVLGIIFGGFIAFNQFKMIHFMELMERHAFARNQHMFETTRQNLYREFFNKYFTEDEVVLDDSTATLTQQIMRSLHDGLKPRLEEKYTIKVEKSDVNANYKKLTFTDKATGRVTVFDTATDKAEARRFGKDVSATITHDDNWVKRIWYKRRITEITGTKWHWLDPIKQPANKARVAAANAVAKYLVSSSSKAGSLGEQLLVKLMGGNDEAVSRVRDAVSKGVADESIKFVSQAIVTKAAVSATGVGLVVTATGMYCGVSDIITDNPLRKTAQQKAEIELMTQSAADFSRASQIKTGATNGAAVDAMNQLLVYKDKQGKIRDYSESNNYRRAAGESVPFENSYDCDDWLELCQSRVPAAALSETTVGKTLTKLSEFANSPANKIFGSLSPVPLPGSATQKAMCFVYSKTIGLLGDLLGSGVDAALSVAPPYRKFKDLSGDVISSMSNSVTSKIYAPVVDAGTVGPFLANADLAGAVMNADSVAGGLSGTGLDESQACHNKPLEERKQDSSYCAPKRTQAEAIALNQTIIQEGYEEYQNSSFMTKIASIGTPYSLAGRLITATPSTPEAALDRTNRTMAAVISPRSWSSIIKNLSNIFTQPALAADAQGIYPVDANGEDQFKTPVRFYTDGELANTENPSTFNVRRNVGCSMVMGLKDKTGQSVKKPSDCPANSAAPADAGSLPDDDLKSLAQQIIDNSKINKIGRLVMSDLEAAAAGRNGSAGVPFKKSLLALIVKMGEDHTFNITALQSGGTGHSRDSAHFHGSGVDIDGVDGDPAGGENNEGRTANDIKLIKEIAPLMPTSTATSISGFGQQGCQGVASIELPAGI
jgi:hypothetical protein